MKRVLIIGGDSYVARSFIKYHNYDFSITTISRVSRRCPPLIAEVKGKKFQVVYILK